MTDQVTFLQTAFWFCALFLGGLVKGTTGFGLPLIALPLLSLILPIPTAIVTLVLAIFLSNVYLIGREGIKNIDAVRFGPLILFMIIGIVIGAWFLSAADETLIYRALGAIIVAFAILNMTQTRIEVPTERQSLYNPLVGLTAGILGGMSTLMGPILILYLSSLGLAPNVFVATIAFLYLIAVTAITLALASFEIVTYDEFSLSLAAIFPVFAGLWIGGKIRRHLTVDRFLVVIDVLLVFMGVSLIAKG